MPGDGPSRDEPEDDPAMLDTHLQRALVHELDIIWFEDIDEIDYVRQDAFLLRGRSTAPPRHAGERRIIGYATVDHASRRVGGYCLRRVFWLNPYDRALDPCGPYFRGVPVEAVDPRTVRPGVLGEVSKRAFDGSPQEAKRTI